MDIVILNYDPLVLQGGIQKLRAHLGTAKFQSPQSPPGAIIDHQGIAVGAGALDDWTGAHTVAADYNGVLFGSISAGRLKQLVPNVTPFQQDLISGRKHFAVDVSKVRPWGARR